jgi:hypothetical protein
VDDFVCEFERGSRRALPPFRTVAAKNRDGGLQAIHGVELDARDQCGLLGITRRNDQLRETRVARAQHHRKNAADGLKLAVQSQFSQSNKLSQRGPIDLLVDSH